MNEDTQNHPNTPEIPLLINGISKIQALAIVKKANGFTNKEISDELDVSVNTIKTWFSTRGTQTYRAYKKYCEEMITQIGLDSLHRIRLQTEKAVDTIIGLMDEKNSPAIRLRASMYILEKDLPFTLKEKADRADFLGKYLIMMKEMGVDVDDLSADGERGEIARKEFDRNMSLLDEAESWT